MRPAAGRTRPEMARNSDVLPAPFGPTTATALPWGTTRSIPRRASTAPYRTTSPLIVSRGDWPVPSAAASSLFVSVRIISVLVRYCTDRFGRHGEPVVVVPPEHIAA